MRKKNSTETFIIKARIKHGGKYDFSKVEYGGYNEKIFIICPEHGLFKTTPNAFLHSYGCPKCGHANGKRIKDDYTSPNKQCHRCKGEFPRTKEFFYAQKKSGDGLQGLCISCCRETVKKWIIVNREYVNKKHREYVHGNEKVLEATRKWIRENKTKYNEIRGRSLKKRRISDKDFAIQQNMRCAIHSALKRNGADKKGKIAELLGCSINFLRKYLESLFRDGMTWDNYGFRGWHIDHIRPCASFDLTQTEQQKGCFHYTNLQPLWWRENISKGSCFNGIRYRKGDNIEIGIFA